MKDFRYMAIVAVAAAGLALAGCSSSSGVSTSERDAAVAAEAAKTKALQDRIDALYAALGIDEDADPNATIADLQTKANELEQMVADKEMADADAARMAMAKTGKDLFAALAGTQADGSDDALDNVEAFTSETGLTSSGLVINAASNAGTLTDDPDGVTLKAGDSAGALGSWSGTDYALSTGTGDAKVTNEARVYTNQGPAKSQPFSGTGGRYELTAGGIVVAGSGAIAEADLDLVMAATFDHQGTQTHQVPEKSDAVYVRGTYDGAPGEYSCAIDCTSTNNGSGSPSGLGGDWTFTPDKGAMVSQPDANYLYYGWWVSKDKDGMPTAASAFAHIVGDVDGDGSPVSGSSLTGSATYAGHAAGKFALDYSRNKVLDGASNGGHFTADAELKATFGPAPTAGVTGTIDNFRLNDGTEDPGWSVALARGGLGDAGAITPPTGDDALATVWSIDGTAAAASGTWSGQMYDEMPGDPPGGDGNNIPTTVTGTFYSEYGASTSSVVGRMVGAFGANKQ